MVGPLTDPGGESQSQHKLKRLKTRKERSQMTGGRKQTRSYVTHCQNSQEPSIITDSRLIGRPGLFSHEIKSIDIERLLSEQSKCEKRGEKVKKMNNETLLLSSSSHVSAPLHEEDLFAADANGEASMGSCEPERCSSSILPYRGQLLDAGEPELFPKEPDHFGMDSFPAHISPPSHSRHFQRFRRCREPSPSPAPSSDYTDMRHYPPSYMLERSPGPPHTSSFPSPEHWSFPPMRLY
uniref:Uncharacterized protein n=1 Tax=Oryzias latipes TaxID=8090 RepID=A0A3P9K0C1_ORYLA